MTNIQELSDELAVLNGYVKQRIHDAKNEQLSFEHRRMVSPLYERELFSVMRIFKLLKQVYHDE